MLQVGGENWSNYCILPYYVVYTYVDNLSQLNRDTYEVVLIGRSITAEESEILFTVTRAYTLFVVDNVQIEGPLARLYKIRIGHKVSVNAMNRFLTNELKYFYAGSTGRNHGCVNVAVSPDFKGEMKWSGNHQLTLSGNFGTDYKQVVYWRENLHIHREQTMELWLEYKKTEGVSIQLEAIQFAPNKQSRMVNYWSFDEDDMKQVVLLDSSKGKGPVSVSVRAKGEGILEIVSLHHRRSRGGYGHYLPGGKRTVTSDREEIFAYFDPGNVRPPLNVFFSDYNTMETFEGYQLMRQLKHPFLLLADNRLAGGGAYMGSREYEAKILEILNEATRILGFSKKQVLMSGISMGACGALYYATKFKPDALVLAKPVLSLGDMATMEKKERPGGFPESFDLLLKHVNALSLVSAKRLNERFWVPFCGADWRGVKICLTYMCQDELDPTAYERILTNVQSEGVEVYGKGLQGRHDDATQTMMESFMEQLQFFMKN